MRHPDPDANDNASTKDSKKTESSASPTDTKATDKNAKDKKNAAPVAVDNRPVPGDHVSVVDDVDLSTVPDGTVRYYIAVGVAGKGKGRVGAASPVLLVPLTKSPAPPADLAITYDELNLTMTWTAGTAKAFRVFTTGAAFDRTTAKLVTPVPILRRSSASRSNSATSIVLPCAPCRSPVQLAWKAPRHRSRASHPWTHIRPPRRPGFKQFKRAPVSR